MIIYLKHELSQLHKPLYILLSGCYQCRGILSFLGEQELMKNQRTERRHYKIFCVNVKYGIQYGFRIFYLIALQNEENYEREESCSA